MRTKWCETVGHRGVALAWVLRDPRISSAVIGASREEQIRESVALLANLTFEASEFHALQLP